MKLIVIFSLILMVHISCDDALKIPCRNRAMKQLKASVSLPDIDPTVILSTVGSVAAIITALQIRSLKQGMENQGKDLSSLKQGLENNDRTLSSLEKSLLDLKETTMELEKSSKNVQFRFDATSVGFAVVVALLAGGSNLVKILEYIANQK